MYSSSGSSSPPQPLHRPPSGTEDLSHEILDEVVSFAHGGSVSLCSSWESRSQRRLSTDLSPRTYVTVLANTPSVPPRAEGSPPHLAMSGAGVTNRCTDICRLARLPREGLDFSGKEAGDHDSSRAIGSPASLVKDRHSRAWPRAVGGPISTST